MTVFTVEDIWFDFCYKAPEPLTEECFSHPLLDDDVQALSLDNMELLRLTVSEKFADSDMGEEPVEELTPEEAQRFAEISRQTLQRIFNDMRCKNEAAKLPPHSYRVSYIRLYAKGFQRLRRKARTIRPQLIIFFKQMSRYGHFLSLIE